MEGKYITVPVADIESRALSKVSLMPVGVADGMSPTEFTDLIAYLSGLRSGRQATPGEGTVARLLGSVQKCDACLVMAPGCSKPIQACEQGLPDTF